ncbi:ABC transporter permease [Akkermansiaceae bacterium]|nr:ABC transporter permease [Akkermansiaceae bacterium]MDA7518848.1 ABC transporter permease [Akkermansiaceae bacterium]MDA8991989.1 ABC transporter permease [Akkermansiaceae bacterium]MDB4142866.1 ABC transporter permease [Akkermansiaceae bacterium]MDB4305631.1 ABC transporter permease [Akkermansiaceae bacterium]
MSASHKTMNRKRKKTSFISPRRILIIAQSTVTQLVRMKIFYFLAPIAALFVAIQFFDAPWYSGPEASMPQQELQMHKNLCLGTMMLFSSLFAIVSTSLLIPRDVEDRTLYTILCKPVPRLDYLAGKLIGVMAVIFVALAAMDLILVITLHFRTEAVLADVEPYLRNLHWPEDRIQEKLDEIRGHGPSLVLQYGVLAYFFKASVVAAVALLISTFSTSTLFTIATSVMIWIIGAAQNIARQGLFDQGGLAEDSGPIAKVLATLVSLLFPDFQIFDSVADAAARAGGVTPEQMLHLGGFTFFYLAIYTVLSWFVFSDKEF